MNDKLSKSQLLLMLNKIMRPEEFGLSEAEGDKVLLAFCAGCPDPLKARWLIVECLDQMTDAELVDRALAMPARPLSEVPASELPIGHPLRTMAK